VSPALRSWVHWTAVTLVASFAVLLATGLWLTWNYRPIGIDRTLLTDGPAWARNVAILRFVHRGAAPVLTMAAIALVVEGVLLARAIRRLRVVVPGVIATLLAVAAGISGSVLAWDQIALSAEVSGVEGHGYRLLYSPLVREWRVAGTAISADAMPRWFWAHTAVLPVLLLTVLVAVTVHLRRRRAAVPSAGPTVA
jgi:quinol-cytochrome oxidoreductase complex cytochrome b subunit